MTALSANKQIEERPLKFAYGLIASGQRIFYGAAVCRNSSGELVEATAATGLHAVGLADEDVDYAAGDRNLRVRIGCFKLVNSGSNAVAEGHLQETVYFEDDQTVGSLATGMSAAGIAVELDDGGDSVWVNVGPQLISGLAAANNLSDVGSALTSRNNLAVNVRAFRDVADDGALTLATGDHRIRLGSTTGTKAATMTTTGMVAGQAMHVTLQTRSGGSYTLAALDATGASVTVTLDAAGEGVRLYFDGTAWNIEDLLGGATAA